MGEFAAVVGPLIRRREVGYAASNCTTYGGSPVKFRRCPATVAPLPSG